MDTLTRTDESSAPGARLLLAFELSQRVWKLGFTLGVGLIRSRGRFPKGGYDVHHGRHSDPKTTASTVHGGVPGGCRAAGPR